MMRRIEGSVYNTPVDGIGISLIRWPRSRGPAPRPMTSLSNNPAFAGTDCCSRLAAASRKPVIRGTAEERGQGENPFFGPRNSKCSRWRGVSYPAWPNDPLGGCRNNCLDLPAAPIVVRRLRVRSYLATRLSRLPRCGVAVSPVPLGVRKGPG